MSDQEVIDHLADYGTWTQQSTGLALTPSDGPDSAELAGAVEIDLGPLPAPVAQARRGRLAVLSIAAAVALVMAGLAVAWPFGSSSIRTTAFATSAEDPPGPLFVLPNPADGYEIGNGYLDEVQPDDSQRPTQVLVVGSQDGVVYRDLAAVYVGTEPDRQDRTWETIELASGPAELTDGFATVLAQQRDGVWIRVLTTGDRIGLATEVLEGLESGPGGFFRLTGETDLVILYDDRSPESSPAGTSYEIGALMRSPNGVMVETGRAQVGLLLSSAAMISGEAEAIRVVGQDGWQITRQDPEGEWNGIVWQATPSHIIAVSGVASVETILAIAESLTIVDKATWETALPD